MKHTTLYALVAFGLASQAAFAAPTISGRVDGFLTYEAIKTDTTNLVTGVTTSTSTNSAKLNGSGSRVGLKGQENLAQDLDVLYNLEYRLGLDQKEKGNFEQRNTYLGLEHKNYGTVLAGRIYTIDSDIDMVDQAAGYGEDTGVPFSYQGQRANNTVIYKSPKFNNNNTQVSVQYGMNEGVDAGSFELRNNNSVRTINREFGVVNVSHQMGKTYLGAAYTTAGQFNALRGVVSHELNDKITAGVIMQQVDYGSPNKELGALASATYKVNDKLESYIQAGHTNNYGGFADTSHTNAQVGTTYRFNKQARWITTLGTSNKVARNYISAKMDPATQINEPARFDKVRTRVLSIDTGLRYDF